MSRCTRTVARRLRKQPGANSSASSLARVYEPYRCYRSAPHRARAKCIRCSQFAAMATIPYKQNASCAHDMLRFSLSRRGRCPPAARLVATEGTVAGVKKCHRTGRDTTVNSERGECRRGRRPRVLCEINRPASSCTRTAAGSVERGHR